MNVYEQIAEHLEEKLGRIPTDAELNAYLEELEAKYYDAAEAELKGN